MSDLQFLSLILHIFLGVAAVICSYAVWMYLVRPKLHLHTLGRWSFWAFVLTVISWITGGYYYVTYYGKTVKPVILAGKYAWVHTIMTESKEHFFLLLPFLTLVLYLVIRFFPTEITEQPRVRSAIIWLAGIASVIGFAVTLFGVVISGAVR